MYFNTLLYLRTQYYILWKKKHAMIHKDCSQIILVSYYINHLKTGIILKNIEQP
jgi:hypothetical protein